MTCVEFTQNGVSDYIHHNNYTFQGCNYQHEQIIKLINKLLESKIKQEVINLSNMIKILLPRFAPESFFVDGFLIERRVY